MATVETDTIEILINDIPVNVPKGELIVESVKRIGLEIPIFCYHPRMKPVGMCRMCLVEVGFKQPDGSIRKMPKPQAACSLPAGEGMAIYTDSEMVHRDRKGVLEFLLVNHPLDCPICDRGGECPLQNNTLFYGPSTSRFVEFKRHAPKAFPLSQYVTLDLERCIQCGRCVRFTEEISGDSQLAFRFRGAAMQPSTFELTDFESKFSGNVIEICPVGALTSAKYRFRARPWDLETKAGVCTKCSNGCNIWMDYRVGKLVRINGRTHEGINEEWTCDRGKFGYEDINAESRLDSVMVRQDNKLVKGSWSDGLNSVLAGLKSAGSSVGVIASPTLSNEDLYLAKSLFADRIKTPSFDSRLSDTPLPFSSPADVATKIADFEGKSKIILFGTSLADEEPIVYLRVRKAATRFDAEVINVTEKATEAGTFATRSVRVTDGNWVGAAEALAGDLAGAVVVTTDKLLDQAGGLEAIERLRDLCEQHGAEFNRYGLHSNSLGAHLIGFAPQNGGLNAKEILAGCAKGEIKLLWVLGLDLFKHFDRDLVEAAIENVETLVLQVSHRDKALEYSSVVLPLALPAEAEGSFTNVEGRIQRLPQILEPKGESKPAWKVFFDVDVRLRDAAGDWANFQPLFNSGEVLARLAQDVAAFSPAKAGEVPAEGVFANLSTKKKAASK